MQFPHQTDEELIAEYKISGNQKIVKALYLRYEVQVFRTLMHFLKHAQDAEDASIDLFIELSSKLRTNNVENFKSWLYVVCKNHALKKLKTKSRGLMSEVIFSALYMKNEGNTDHIDELVVQLPQAINQLKEDQRWCIVLFYLHGKSYKEIENIRGYDFNKVKSSLIHGKKNLLKLLNAYENEPK